MRIVEEFKHTYRALGPFTRTWVNAAFVMAVCQMLVSLFFLGYFGDLFSLDWHAIRHLQLWRLVTSFICLGTFFGFLINVWFLVTVVDSVERFMSRRDLCAFVAFSSFTLFGLATVYDIPYISFSMLLSFMVQYVAVSPYEPLSIWFWGLGTLMTHRWVFPLMGFIPIVLFGGLESYLFGLLTGLVWVAVMRYLPSYEPTGESMEEMSDVEHQPCAHSGHQSVPQHPPAVVPAAAVPSPSAPLMEPVTQTVPLA